MASDGQKPPEFGPGDQPGAPGPVPSPSHSSDIPAAPSTNPPEPPVVPSESALADFWNSYGSAMILVAAGLLIAVVVLLRLEG